MNYVYVRVQENPWMEFDVCHWCDFCDDAGLGQHVTVCPKCGSRDISVKIARWITFHPRLTFLQWLAQPFLKDESKCEFYRLVPQFKADA